MTVLEENNGTINLNLKSITMDVLFIGWLVSLSFGVNIHDGQPEQATVNNQPVEYSELPTRGAKDKN